MLMAGTGTEAFAQCYTKNLQQAESLYKQGRYAEAKKRFAAAVAPPVNAVDHIADKLV